MHKIMHGLLHFPCDAVFAAIPTLDFDVILSKFTSGVKPVAANMG